MEDGSSSSLSRSAPNQIGLTCESFAKFVLLSTSRVSSVIYCFYHTQRFVIYCVTKQQENFTNIFEIYWHVDKISETGHPVFTLTLSRILCTASLMIEKMIRKDNANINPSYF